MLKGVCAVGGLLMFSQIASAQTTLYDFSGYLTCAPHQAGCSQLGNQAVWVHYANFASITDAECMEIAKDGTPPYFGAYGYPQQIWWHCNPMR